MTYQDDGPGCSGGGALGVAHLLQVPAVHGPVEAGEQRSPFLMLPLHPHLIVSRHPAEFCC